MRFGMTAAWIAMNVLKSFVPCAVVFAVSSAGAVAQGTEFHVRPKFVVDSTATYEIKENYEVITESPVMKLGRATQSVSRTIVAQFDVQDIDDDGVTIRMVHQRIQFEMNSPISESTFKFDSTTPGDQDATNPIAPVLRPLIGAPITIKLDPTGIIQSVEAPPGLVPSIPLARLSRQFMDTASVQLRLAELFTTRSPKEKQAVGASWTSGDTLDALGGTGRTLTISREHRLESADLTQATIKVAGTASLSEKRAEDANVTIKGFDLKATQVWDPTDGVLSSYESRTVLLGAIEPQPGVTQTIDSTDTKTVKRVK